MRSLVGFEINSQIPFHFKEQQPLTVCAWGGVMAEIHNKDSGDARTIFVLLQSWWDLRPPQRSTLCCYLLKGPSKHIPSTSKKFIFSMPVRWLKPKLSYLYCCYLWSQAHVSEDVLKHVTNTIAFGCAAISFICLIYWDFKLWEHAMFSTEGVWYWCQIL